MADPLVAVVGDANVDMLVRIPDAHSGAQEFEPTVRGGGTGGNTAAALARLGVRTEFAGSVGEDAYGRHVVTDLEAHGVGCREVTAFPERNTVCVFAFIDASGERHLWAWPRDEPSFTVLSGALRASPILRSAEWVHASGMILTAGSSAFPVLVDILQDARQRGATTSFDLNIRAERTPSSWFVHQLNRVLEHCDVVLGSGPDEFAGLGRRPWLDNARALVRENRTVVARDGANGAILLTRDRETHYPALDVPVIDTVGAGDAFNAGFIAASLRSGDLDEAMRWARAVAALSVATEGARNTPDIAAVHDILARADDRVGSR
ncbi:MAG: carbohydrate kinase family protein [Microbacterium sp.]